MVLFLRRIRDAVEKRIQDIESYQQEQLRIGARLWYSSQLFLCYVSIAFCYAFLVLFSSQQKTFEFMNSLSPEQGYHVSYVQHLRWQKTAKLGALSSFVVVVALNVFSGLFLLQEQSLAATVDPYIDTVIHEPESTDPSVTTNHTLYFTTVDAISSATPLWFFFIPTEPKPISTTGFDLSQATFSSDTFSANAIEVDDTKTLMHIFRDEDLPAGTYAFTVSAVINTPTEGFYKAAMSTDDVITAISPLTASGGFDIGDGQADEERPAPPAVECQDMDVVSSLRGVPFGANILLTWKAYPGADSYILYWLPNQNQSAIRTKSEISRTSYLLKGLEPNTLYTLYISAITTDCGAIATSKNIQISTEAKLISEQRYRTLTVPKKKRATTQVVIRWKTKTVVQSYQLQVFTKEGKRIANIKDILRSKNSRVIKGLKPGTAYKARIRATYQSNETTKFSRFIRFKTAAAGS